MTKLHLVRSAVIRNILPFVLCLLQIKFADAQIQPNNPEINHRSSASEVSVPSEECSSGFEQEGEAFSKTSIDESSSCYARTPNQAPTVNAGVNLSHPLIEIGGTPLLCSYIDDGLPLDSSPITLWFKESGPGTVLFSPNGLYAEAIISVPGTYVLTCVVYDGELVSTDSLVLTVTEAPPNAAPDLNAGPGGSVFIDHQKNYAAFNLQGTADDDGLPAEGALVTEWKLSGEPPDGAEASDIVFMNPFLPQSQVRFFATGIYELALTATDGALTVEEMVTVTVNPPPNFPPDITAADDGFTEMGENGLAHYILQATLQDEDDPISEISTAWVLLGGPPGNEVTIKSPDELITEVIMHDPGEYLFQILANDGDGVDVDTIVVTVLEATGGNSAPISFAADHDVPLYQKEGNTPPIFQLHAVDPDGDPLSYHLVEHPTNVSVSIDEQSGLAVVLPSHTQEEEEVFWFKTYDGTSYSDPKPVTVRRSLSMEGINAPPMVESISYTITDIPQGGDVPNQLISFSAYDPEEEPIQIIDIVRRPEHGYITDIDPQSLTATYVNTEYFYGVDRFSYRAFDGSSWSELAPGTIHVLPAPSTTIDDSIQLSHTLHVIEANKAGWVFIPATIPDSEDPDDYLLVALQAPQNAYVQEADAVLHTSGAEENRGYWLRIAPKRGFTGADQFTYYVQGPNGISQSRTMSIAVTPPDTVGVSANCSALHVEHPDDVNIGPDTINVVLLPYNYDGDMPRFILDAAAITSELRERYPIYTWERINILAATEELLPSECKRSGLLLGEPPIGFSANCTNENPIQSAWANESCYCNVNKIYELAQECTTVNVHPYVVVNDVPLTPAARIWLPEIGNLLLVDDLLEIFTPFTTVSSRQKYAIQGIAIGDNSERFHRHRALFTHELHHLFGLGDEYPRPAGGPRMFQPAFPSNPNTAFTAEEALNRWADLLIFNSPGEIPQIGVFPVEVWMNGLIFTAKERGVMNMRSQDLSFSSERFVACYMHWVTGHYPPTSLEFFSHPDLPLSLPAYCNGISFPENFRPYEY